MGLSWINPLYLAGLMLLALPVLIHLVQKHQHHGARFPSLLFLKQIPRRERRRMEIRHWLLMLLRCLLLLLLVFAFARPFLASGGPAGLAPDRVDSVLVLDRSYSMRVADHWQQALDHALRQVDAMTASDRIGILLVDDEVETVSDLSGDGEKLSGLLRDQAPGWRATRLPLAIEQASRMLAGSDALRKRIVVISDFQSSAASTVARVSDDIELETLGIEARGGANASIGSVEIGAAARDAANEFMLQVEVVNHSTQALDQEITLTLDGREMARRTLRLPPGSTRVETFEGLSAGSDLLRGVVSLADDALDVDNRHYFIYSSKLQLPVLIVEGGALRSNQSVYLQNALELARNPAFRIERRALSTLTAEDIATQAVLILNDLSLPAGEMADALGEYVSAGGALLVIAAEASQPDWPESLLPGKPGRAVSAPPASAHQLAQFDAEHPLSLRLGSRNVIGLSLARIFSYRAFETGAEDRVVARYSDGGAALLERQVGEGRVQVLTTTLDTHWNDIVLQPAFVPFLQQNLRYLAAHERFSRESRLGDIVDLLRYARALAGADVIDAGTGGPLVVETPAGAEIRLERDNPLLALAEPGFYQVHQAARAGVEITVAANADTREANLEPLDLDQFVEDIRASATPADAAKPLNRQQAAAREQQQQLAQDILLAVLALMLIEALSANWIGLRQAGRAG